MKAKYFRHYYVAVAVNYSSIVCAAITLFFITFYLAEVKIVSSFHIYVFSSEQNSVSIENIRVSNRITLTCN
jgi:hypothetical protein